jgi:electron transfer flavoprotein beta subunit
MEIIVCVKQVPEVAEVDIDPETGTLVRDGVPAAINPFDLYAIEEALRLREANGGNITAISMGPPQAEAAVRDAIAFGIDRGILLSDRAFAGSDTLATSYALATGIRKIGAYDIIICGIKTTDGDTGQVGPGLAEELEIPHVSYVRKIVEIEDDIIVLERTLDEKTETLRIPLPCLITVTKEINEPRLPSFKGKMASRKAEIPVWTHEDVGAEGKRLGSDGSPTWVVKVFHPTGDRAGEVIEGEPPQQAALLVGKLREKNLI